MCLGTFMMSCGLQAMKTGRELDSKLIEAASMGKKQKVEKLLAEGANIDAQEQLHNKTALMQAAIAGHYDTAELLINKKAKLELQKKNGLTALISAAQEGHQGICELLIANNANLETYVADNRNPLLLDDQEYKGTITALMLAAKNNKKETCELLISKQVNINSQDDYGRTALKLAAQKGHFEICKLLIENGAQINNSPNDTGSTALMWAALYDHYKVCALIIDSMIKHDKVRAATAFYHSLKQNGYGKDMAKMITQQLQTLQKNMWPYKINARAEIMKIRNIYTQQSLLEYLNNL